MLDWKGTTADEWSVILFLSILEKGEKAFNLLGRATISERKWKERKRCRNKARWHWLCGHSNRWSSDGGERWNRKTAQAVLATATSSTALRYSYRMLAHSDAIIHSALSVVAMIGEGRTTYTPHTHTHKDYTLSCIGDRSTTANKKA